MTGAIFAVSLATLLLLAAGMLGRAAFRPRLGVYLPGGGKTAGYLTSSQQNVSLHVKNRGGWLGLPSGPVDAIWTTLYLPDEFDLQSGEYLGVVQSKATAAAQDGRFRGTRFITTGRFSLFKDEVDVVQFTFATPAQTGKYKAYVAVLSEQGSGSVHTLSLTIA